MLEAGQDKNVSDSVWFNNIREFNKYPSVQVSSDLYYYLGLYEYEFATHSSSVFEDMWCEFQETVI